VAQLAELHAVVTAPFLFFKIFPVRCNHDVLMQNQGFNPGRDDIVIGQMRPVEMTKRNNLERPGRLIVLK